MVQYIYSCKFEQYLPDRSDMAIPIRVVAGLAINLICYVQFDFDATAIDIKDNTSVAVLMAAAAKMTIIGQKAGPMVLVKHIPCSE